MNIRISTRVAIRALIVTAAAAATLSLVSSWRTQAGARLSCTAMFEPRNEHNGYLQLNVLGPHPTEQYFEGELFLYYPATQSPPDAIHMVRHASGPYAAQIIEAELSTFSRGLATPGPVPVSLPTPGISQRRFPFDSPTFEVALSFEPAIRPTAVIVRNLSPDFIPDCQTLRADWKQGTLSVRVGFRRNPFVQGTVIFIALASVVFGALLGLIRETDDLAVATASFFFSIWSIRSIVAPPGLGYSSLLDLWLMGTALLVLFVVAWRLTKGLPRGTPPKR